MAPCHNEFSILTNSTKICQQCNLLFSYFRVYRKRLSIRNKTYVGSTLTPTRRSILKQILRKTKMVKKSNKRRKSVKENNIYNNYAFIIFVYLRFKIRVEQLNVTLNEVQCKSKNLTNESVADLFESNNLNTSQITIIQEIINASKVMNTKNRRYSENWILLCILLKIR